jgi:hypothetical protein
MSPAPPTGASLAVDPNRKVWFETDRGEMTAYYHDVVRSGAALVLVFDDRYRGGRFFPRVANEPFVVIVDDGPMALLVESTGFQYPYGHHTFHVLMVTREVATAELEAAQARG